MGNVNTLCVFNESRESKYRDFGTLFSKLQSSDPAAGEWKIEYVESLDGFSTLLKKKTLSLVVFIFSEEPSQGLIDLISKNRNATHLREAGMVSIHRKTSASGLQKTLMMGVKTIFSEPIEKKLILHRIKATLDQTRPPVLLGSDFEKTAPLEFSGEVFGRVGKIMLSPFGGFQVETDARFPDKRTITMRTKIAKDLGMSKFHLNVQHTTLEDIYYQYGYGYRLLLDMDSILNKKFGDWIKNDPGRCFVQPKTKILWVSSTAVDEVENLFDKNIFSLRVELPGKCTQAFLSNLNPKILVVGDIPQASLDSILKWLELAPKGDRMVFTTAHGHAHGHPSAWIRLQDLSREALQATFMTLVRPFLNRRIESAMESGRYLSRKSDYSRCSFPIEGKVLRSSGAYVELELGFILDKGCIFLAHHPFSAYLKVVYVEAFINKNTYHVTCEYVPFTEKAAPFFKELQDQSVSTVMPRPEVMLPEISKSKNEPFFLEAKPFWRDFTKVAIGLIVAGIIATAIYILAPNTPLQSREPASMEDFFESVRNVFK